MPKGNKYCRGGKYFIIKYHFVWLLHWVLIWHMNSSPMYSHCIKTPCYVNWLHMNIMSILRDTLYTIIYSNQYLNRYILVKIDSYHLKTLFSLCKVDNKVTLENATQEDSRFWEVADIDSDIKHGIWKW